MYIPTQQSTTPMFLNREHFYVFYTAQLLDIENNSTHIHMEKFLEQSPDVSALVQ